VALRYFSGRMNWGSVTLPRDTKTATPRISRGNRHRQPRRDGSIEPRLLGASICNASTSAR
jgi:hypothetical protein